MSESLLSQFAIPTKMDVSAIEMLLRFDKIQQHQMVLSALDAQKLQRD